MITINKNSWLHRFNIAISLRSRYYWDEQTNLCNYFWGTVINILKVVFFLSVILSFLFLVGTLPMGIDNGFTDGFAGVPVWILLVTPFAGTAFILALLAFAFGLAWIIMGIGKTAHWLIDKTFRRKRKPKKSSIIKAMFHGFKHKYCPRMEVK